MEQEQIEQVEQIEQADKINELQNQIIELNKTLENQTKLFNEKLASLTDNYLTNTKEIKSSIQELKEPEIIDVNDDRYNF